MPKVTTTASPANTSTQTANQIVEQITGTEGVKVKISKRKLQRVPKSVSQEWDVSTYVKKGWQYCESTYDPKW